MDWKNKMCSRKFWAAIAAFVSMLIITLGESQETATKVASLIMAGAACVAYIFGEGLVDAANAQPEIIIAEKPPDNIDIVDETAE